MNSASKMFYFALILFFTITLPSICLAWRGKVVSVTDGYE